MSPHLRSISNAPPPTAILGPTNTGKTYFAIERLLSHPTGMIGLPLRLLAREVYDKLVARRSKQEVALVTGEEKIIPAQARYWVATVEAMPLERQTHFLAIDEIQLAADFERGRIFTSRLLHARGTSETLFLGSETMRPILSRLFPDIVFTARDRLSVLSYAGAKKVTRLPRRSAVVAFSADTVYAVAELIRRQRGGAAVVLGALSPRTRNAQAELYQSGEVDYLVATDAIGMGLNMDIDHVAFAARRKFDGRAPRNLREDELAQIAGRAGRHLRDGTFGVTSDCYPFDDDVVEAIENHQFAPVKALQWRSDALEFLSLPALMNSLAKPPPRPELVRARPGDDEETLQRLAGRPDIRERASGGAALKLLWDVCQIPDFRNIAYDEHARLVGEIYEQVIDSGAVNEDWLAARVKPLDRTDGDIDSLSARIAHVRSWTYLSNTSAWLRNAAYWQEKTRRIEDKLSDALHEKLTQRFVDRRTSVLLKKLKDDVPLLAGVKDDGDVIVEGQFVGRLIGFEFIVDPSAKGPEAKRVRAAADKALTPLMAARASALANAKTDELSLDDDGVFWWRASPVAHLEKGPAALRPRLVIRALDRITPSLRGRVEDRLSDYLSGRIEALLGPLILLNQAAEAGESGDLSALARGVAYRVVENFGAMSRVHFGDELKQLNQDERAKLRKLGMRFGEYTLFLPTLLKPAPARLLILLWALWGDQDLKTVTPLKAGLVSTPVVDGVPHAFYYASGYRPSGTRAVRIDMLERLAGQIRSDRKDANAREGFEATSQMMSLVGCSGEEFEGILKSLGYRKQTIKRRKLAAVEPVKPSTVDQAGHNETTAQSAADGSDKSSTQQQAPAATDQVTEIANDAETTSPEAAAPATETAGDETAAASTPEATPTDEADTTEISSQPSAGDAEQVAPTASVETETTAATTPDAPIIAEAEDEEIEVVVWRFAPRRPPQKRQQNRSNSSHNKKGAQSGDNKRADNRGTAKNGRKGNSAGPGKGRRDHAPSPYKGSPRNAPKKGAEGHAPRHRKVADPDSPFAVLAGLKSDLSKPSD